RRQGFRRGGCCMIQQKVESGDLALILDERRATSDLFEALSIQPLIEYQVRDAIGAANNGISECRAINAFVADAPAGSVDSDAACPRGWRIDVAPRRHAIHRADCRSHALPEPNAAAGIT